ncbi:MAG: PDZ domain-containing protein, partial [Desulfuromonadales bacterium]
RTATPGVFTLQAGADSEGTTVRSDLELLGTVVAGSRSLALLRSGQDVRNYRLDEEIPGGKIEEIIRHQITIRNHNGSLTILRMFEEGATGLDSSRTSGAPTASTESGGTVLSRNPLRARSQAPEGETAGGQAAGVVRSLGANRWVVARSAAESARENVGEQLRTALIQPNLVNGKTDGFVVKSIQPGTLLAQMGLQPGDVLKRVNQTPLDSPEKALQIMQQLREARQLSIDLERGGKPLSFVYEIE